MRSFYPFSPVIYLSAYGIIQTKLHKEDGEAARIAQWLLENCFKQCFTIVLTPWKSGFTVGMGMNSAFVGHWRDISP